MQNSNSSSLKLSVANSIGALEELVECGICLEKLKDSRMLPCQHTFCLSCLQTHLLVKHFRKSESGPSIEEIKKTIQSKRINIHCPICQSKYQLEKGFDSLKLFPKNLHIDSLLQILDKNVSPVPVEGFNTIDFKCCKCQEGLFLINGKMEFCKQCDKTFCSKCYTNHLKELNADISSLTNEITEAEACLNHKYENFENMCNQLEAKISETTLNLIEEIRLKEKKVLDKISLLRTEKKIKYNNFLNEIDFISKQLQNDIGHLNMQSFASIQKETLSVLVQKFVEPQLIFDHKTFSLTRDDTDDDTNDKNNGKNFKHIKAPISLKCEKSMIQFYKSNPLIPKLIWDKCPRPAHLAVAPWNNELLYITATDTRTVLVLNRKSNRIEKKLSAPEMLFPQGIVFGTDRIYISDKWQHCIHVFSQTGEYLRNFFCKGSEMGNVRMPGGLAMGDSNQLVIADTGNDRILLVDTKKEKHVGTIGVVNKKRILDMPTSVAVSNRKIIVADSGNHKIKIFNFLGEKLSEFGSMGRGLGAFKSIETVVVDPAGLILVGDAGNERIQIFRQDGSLVKVFGKMGKGTKGLGWVSGILITDELDIITTDIKARCLRIF